MSFYSVNERHFNPYSECTTYHSTLEQAKAKVYEKNKRATFDRKLEEIQEGDIIKFKHGGIGMLYWIKKLDVDCGKLYIKDDRHDL